MEAAAYRWPVASIHGLVRIMTEKPNILDLIKITKTEQRVNSDCISPANSMIFNNVKTNSVQLIWNFPFEALAYSWETK